MAEKNYTSAIALGLISVSLVVMASIVPVHGGGFIVLASFFCCGFIGQILVVNGIMTVTIGDDPRLPERVDIGLLSS